MKHAHQWGTWFNEYASRPRNVPRRLRIRLCVNGHCPMGQYKNGRVFIARPERKAVRG